MSQAPEHIIMNNIIHMIYVNHPDNEQYDLYVIYMPPAPEHNYHEQYDLYVIYMPPTPKYNYHEQYAL